MISITRAQVPAYLRESEFFASLSSDDSEEFSIPIANFKLNTEVEDLEQLTHLLHTLRYWGKKERSYTSSLIHYLVSVARNDQDVVLELLSSFADGLELASWFRAYHVVHDVDSATVDESNETALVVLTDSIDELSPFMLAKNETMRRNTFVALAKAAGSCESLGGKVFTTMCSQLPDLEKLLKESAPVTEVRSVATFLAAALKSPFDASSTVVSLVLLLSRLLSWPDDEVVVETCHAVRNFMDQSEDHIQYLLDAGFASRLIELISGSAEAVVEAALDAVAVISVGSIEQRQVILDLNAVPKLIKLLNKRNTEASLLAMKVTGGVFGGSPAQRKIMTGFNIMPMYVTLAMTSSGTYAVRYQCQFLALIHWRCRFVQLPELQKWVEQGIIPPACEALRTGTVKTKCDGLYCVRTVLERFSDDQPTPTASFLLVKSQLIDHGALEFASSHLDVDDIAVQCHATVVHQLLVDLYA